MWKGIPKLDMNLRVKSEQSEDWRDLSIEFQSHSVSAGSEIL